MRYKLGDVCAIKYGKDHKKLADGSIPVYGSGGIMRYADTALYSKKSVLIPRKGSLANLYFVDGPFWTVDTCFYTEIDETKTVPEYLYYLLKTYDLAGMDVGSAVPSLTTALLNEVEVDLPPLDVQRTIAVTLSALEAKIAINNKLNHNLEQTARAIFAESFGGEELNGTLGEIASVTSGKRPPFRQAASTSEANIPLIGASSIMGFTNAVLYHEKVLITGRVGTHGIIQRYSRPCWASDNTLVIKSNYYEFVYQQLCLVDFTNMNVGTSQPLITQTDLKNVPIFIPDIKTLIDFEKTSGALMEQYEQNVLDTEALASLRDNLLPQLMSGKLSVADG